MNGVKITLNNYRDIYFKLCNILDGSKKFVVRCKEYEYKGVVNFYFDDVKQEHIIVSGDNKIYPVYIDSKICITDKSIIIRIKNSDLGLRKFGYSKVYFNLLE